VTTFEYLSVFVSIVIGLAVVRLLSAFALILTREGVRQYWVHTTWIAYYLVWLPYFWWFTLGWRDRDVWTFGLFLFVVAYAMLAFLAIVILVPPEVPETTGYEEHFFRVRRPFFVALTALFLMDLVDSVAKGPDNLAGLGPTYFPLMAVLITGHVAAAITTNRRYHAAWVVFVVGMFITFSIGPWADVWGAS
jgi:hypothetical protein